MAFAEQSNDTENAITRDGVILQTMQVITKIILPFKVNSNSKIHFVSDCCWSR